MKHMQTKTTGILTMALCAAMIGCNPPNTENQQTEKPEVKQDTSDFSSDFLKKIQGVNSGSCNAARTAAAETEFKNTYALNLPPVKLALRTGLDALLQSKPSSPNQGLVFHYGLANPTNLASVQYIIGPGVQNGTTGVFAASPYLAGENGQNAPHYILLDATAPNGAFRYIDEAEYCQLTDNYFNHFQMTQDGVRDVVKNIPLHPFLVYHQGSELKKFYDQNNLPATTHLYVKHCSDSRSSSLPKFHLPFLLFGDGNAPFQLATDNATTYTNKALDVGHPCPPFCGTAQIPAVKCD